MEPFEYIEEVTNIDGFNEELVKVKEKLLSLPGDVPQYPNLLFLGTGSCIPNKTRNTSGILLNIRLHSRKFL